MARKIRFIAPIESMSGNMSGLQELLYPTDDNAAYDSPEGKVNYARNYKPRYVGTYRSKDGAVSFQVKTRTAVNMTPESKLAMATLGAVGACIGAILRVAVDKAACEAQMAVENEQGYGWKSLREFLDAKIRPAILAKQSTIVINPVGGIYNNPFVLGGTGRNLAISSRTLVKFWKQLADNPITFTVAGLNGIAENGMTFEELIGSSINVLQLTADSSNHVKYGQQWLMLNERDYVEKTHGIEDNEKFKLTTVAPA